jgi:transcriptional regulator with XRE-family HTH domain
VPTIREIRLATGLSQRAFATRLQIPFQTYRPFDSDRRAVPHDRMMSTRVLSRLFWTAVINGLVAPPILVVIMPVANNRRLMGELRPPGYR